MSETRQKARSNVVWFIGGVTIAVVGALLASQLWSSTGDGGAGEQRVTTAVERVGSSDNIAASSVVNTDRDLSAEATPSGTNAAIKLTDDNFVDEVLKSPKPVLVDFWAAWCKPCNMLAPAIDEMATSFGDTAVIGKLNVDENPLVAGALKVQALPTLLIFKDGMIVDQIIGAASPDHIAQKLHAVVQTDAS